MLLPVGWEGSKDSFEGLGKGFFICLFICLCYYFEELFLQTFFVLTQRKHSRDSLLTKHPDTEYTEL